MGSVSQKTNEAVSVSLRDGENWMWAKVVEVEMNIIGKNLGKTEIK